MTIYFPKLFPSETLHSHEVVLNSELCHTKSHRTTWLHNHAMHIWALHHVSSPLGPATIRQVPSKIKTEYSRCRVHWYDTKCSWNVNIYGRTSDALQQSKKSVNFTLPLQQGIDVLVLALSDPLHQSGSIGGLKLNKVTCKRLGMDFYGEVL